MNKFTFYLFVFSVFCGKDVLCKELEHNQTESGRIVGGDETTIQSYPYMAYLSPSNGTDSFTCGGFIVSEYYIVTAAHCFFEGTIEIDIRIGSTQSDSGGTQYTTTTFNSHPMFNYDTGDYDVAIVSVKEGMTLDGTNARAIDLVEEGSDVAEGKNVVVTGWGFTKEGGSESTTLKVVTVPAVDRDECNEQKGGDITNRMFCAGFKEGGEDSCQGDSGGPAVVDGLAAGVVSYGTGCGEPNSPGVYTRIGHHSIRQYIFSNTKV